MFRVRKLRQTRFLTFYFLLIFFSAYFISKSWSVESILTNPNTLDYSIQWERTFGEESENEGAFSISEMEGDNFLVVGDDKTGSPSDSDYVSKIELKIVNSSGYSQRVTNFSESHGEFSYTAIQTSDDGIALLGSFASFSPQQVILIKINQEKEIEWSKTLSNCGRGVSLVQTNDHGFVFACVGKNVDSTASYETKLVKVNATGDVQWERYFDNIGGLWDWKTYSVIQTIEGDLVLLTKVTTLPLEDDDLFSQNRNLRLIRVNNTGEVLWDINFGTSENEFAREVIQTADGNFVVLGEILFRNRTSSIYLAKISTYGEMLWKSIFLGYNPYSLIQGENQSFTLLALEGYQGSSMKSVLIKTDNKGNLIGMYSFGALNPTDSHSYNRAFDFVQRDDYFIVVGHTSAYAPAAVVDFWILRINMYNDTVTTDNVNKTSNDINTKIIQLEIWSVFTMIVIISFRKKQFRK